MAKKNSKKIHKIIIIVPARSSSRFVKYITTDGTIKMRADFLFFTKNKLLLFPFHF